MKKSFLFVLLLLTVSLFLGCKKYEDGPFFTLRTIKHRLTKDTWRLDNLTINGIDSTSYYKEIDFSIDFEDRAGLGNGKIYWYTQRYTYKGQLITVPNGGVEFDKDGDYITLESYLFNSNGNFDLYSYFFSADPYSGKYVSWKIKKLTSKEFWLEGELPGAKASMKLSN